MHCGKRMPYGQKAPFTVADVEAVRRSRALGNNVRDRALFEIALSSALRGSDLVRLRVDDVQDAAGVIRREALIRQQKTAKVVRFVISEPARAALRVHIDANSLTSANYLFTAARLRARRPLSVHAFRTIVKGWADAAGYRDVTRFGAHSMRRSKATRIYHETKDIEAVKHLLGHTSLSVTERYLGVSKEKALEVSRQYDF